MASALQLKAWEESLGDVEQVLIDSLDENETTARLTEALDVVIDIRGEMQFEIVRAEQARSSDPIGQALRAFAKHVQTERG